MSFSNKDEKGEIRDVFAMKMETSVSEQVTRLLPKNFSHSRTLIFHMDMQQH